MDRNPTTHFVIIPDTEGVLGRRIVAYLIDFVVILAFMLVLGIAILILGVVTFGLGWLLFAILAPGAAILYTALTMGGPMSSTLGMRFCGVAVGRVRGCRTRAGIDPTARRRAALLFLYSSVTTLRDRAGRCVIGLFPQGPCVWAVDSWFQSGGVACEI